jgi:uncharacterized membrane protein YdbT with pleckstrin-like domain
MEMMGDETVIWEGHPTWRATLSFHIKGILVTLALVLLIVLANWLGAGISAGIPALILVVGVGLTIAVGWAHRFFTQYAITTKRLHMRRGILSKTESSTNVDRIQNITVHQSPVDRILKVGSIDFDTASDDPTDRFSFIGVDRPQDLRDRIMLARDAEKSAAGPRDEQGGLA